MTASYDAELWKRLLQIRNLFSYQSTSDGNLTCKTRFGSPVFCDNCLRSLASGLWFIAKYDFIVRNWWCLNDVRIRFVRDDALPMLPRPKPKSIYSEFKSGNGDKEIKNYKIHFATRSEIADNIYFSISLPLSYDLLLFDHYLIKHLLSLLFALRRRAVMR